MDFDPALIERLPPEKRELFEQLQAVHHEIAEANPLEIFHACPQWCGSPYCPEPSKRSPTGGRPKQHEFMADRRLIVASNAGNRFGKTTAMVVYAIIQHTPDDMLPERLKVFKRKRKKPGLPVQGRYHVPTDEFFTLNVWPVLRQWMPTSLLKGGSWQKAFRTSPRISVTFEDGGTMTFPTYKMDASSLAGFSGDYELWDEPPPEDHWNECLVRVLDRGGCHKVGMTPVNMVGGGIGWVLERIFEPGFPENEAYDPSRFHVVSASIWDNPDYSAEEIESVLSLYPEDERQAREHGHFIHFGGMIYPGGFEKILVEPVQPPEDADPMLPERLRNSDIYVGIDPGLKNAAFVWVAFDRDNRALAFAELILHEKTPIDYARAIRKVNSLFRLHKDPIYVIDPSARNRSLTNAESVQTELQRQGITRIVHGKADVHAGVQSVRRRIQEGGLFIGRNLVGLRQEAKKYRMDDTPDGEFKVVKENDHRLDALRYAMMARPWYPSPREVLRHEQLRPGHAPSAAWLAAQDERYDEGPVGPMGRYG